MLTQKYAGPVVVSIYSVTMLGNAIWNDPWPRNAKLPQPCAVSKSSEQQWTLATARRLPASRRRPGCSCPQVVGWPSPCSERKVPSASGLPQQHAETSWHGVEQNPLHLLLHEFSSGLQWSLASFQSLVMLEYLDRWVFPRQRHRGIHD